MKGGVQEIGTLRRDDVSLRFSLTLQASQLQLNIIYSLAKMYEEMTNCKINLVLHFAETTASVV
jgi:hypothetical protein